jgi:hypothetical protein
MRTHYCGLVNAAHLDQTVTLCGWAHRRRDHGGVIFIDLRDREGLVQVVCDPDRKDTFATAERIRNEFVLKVTGLVRRVPKAPSTPTSFQRRDRGAGARHRDPQPAATPPFQLDEDNLSETVRLTHRVIDLRRPQMQKNMMLRYKVAMAFRRFLDAQGFIDIETPMLTKSTPEGARDYLVPSRVHDGQFFALPQSPQLFKQMLMVAGFDRYYQITKCFRDEDLRADRQPEFTQVDIETSFLTEAEITAIMEGADPLRVQGSAERRPAQPLPAHDLCRGDGALRLGQAGPARAAGVHRTHRPHEDGGLQGLPRGPNSRRPRGSAARAGRRQLHPQGDRRLHQVRRHLRRQGPRLHQGQREGQGRRRPAVADRQVPAETCARHPRAHRRRRRRPDVLRRRQAPRS